MANTNITNMLIGFLAFGIVLTAFGGFIYVSFDSYGITDSSQINTTQINSLTGNITGSQGIIKTAEVNQQASTVSDTDEKEDPFSVVSQAFNALSNIKTMSRKSENIIRDTPVGQNIPSWFWTFVFGVIGIIMLSSIIAFWWRYVP